MNKQNQGELSETDGTPSAAAAPESYKEGLLPFEGTPSKFKTWVDISRRMKPQNADDVDWDLFFRKYYGFIISRCRNNEKSSSTRRQHWHLNDAQTLDIIGEVYKKMYRGKRFEYSSSKGSFHSWFAMIINDTIAEYLKKQYARKNFKDEDGNNLLDDIDNVPPDKIEQECDIELPAEYNFDEGDYLAMLAWEEVCESSNNPKQQQFFIWRQEGHKPAEIARRFGVEEKEVSELIRQFKNKLKTAYKRLDSVISTEQLDWAEVITRAKRARKKYDAIVEAFSARSIGNETR